MIKTIALTLVMGTSCGLRSHQWDLTYTNPAQRGHEEFTDWLYINTALQIAKEELELAGIPLRERNPWERVTYYSGPDAESVGEGKLLYGVTQIWGNGTYTIWFKESSTSCDADTSIIHEFMHFLMTDSNGSHDKQEIWGFDGVMRKAFAKFRNIRCGGTND